MGNIVGCTDRDEPKKFSLDEEDHKSFSDPELKIISQVYAKMNKRESRPSISPP
jgi:hypothetical protein